MVALDLYWKKSEWIHFEKDRFVLNDDAPEEAKESYNRYLKQIKKITENSKTPNVHRI